MSKSDSKGELYISALLGTPPGGAKHINANLFFISDFLLAHRLLGSRCSTENQAWVTQLQLYPALRHQREEIPTSQRFQLPMPDGKAGEALFYQTYLSGNDCKRYFLHSIQKHASAASRNDHLIIILFGHGDPYSEVKGQRVQCGETVQGKGVWLDKADVEAKVIKCKARITVISGASFSGAWQSPLWGLFAAARTEETVSLPASESDRHRGSPFAAGWVDFSPSLRPSELTTLDGHSEQPRFNGNEIEHDVLLSPGEFAEAFGKLAESLHNAHQDGNLKHDFTPTMKPDNRQWKGRWTLLGVESSIDIVLALHSLPRAPPRHSQYEPESQQSVLGCPSPKPPSVSVIESDGDENDDDPREVEDDFSSDATEKDLSEAELEALDAFTALWAQKTRPAELTTASVIFLGSLVKAYQGGKLDRKETSALFRFFTIRAAADNLAQDLAAEAGIAEENNLCKEFREAPGLFPSQNLRWENIEWGLLQPRDDSGVDRLEHGYKKASQWLFDSWSRSGKEVDVLEQLLKKVDGHL